jgi:carbamoyltransferase
MWILGIAGSHNSGVALIEDGRVVAAVQTERLVRVKRHAIALDAIGSQTAQAIAYCLRHAGIDLPDVDAIATCTPWEAVRPRFAFAAAPDHALPPFVTVPHHLAHAEYAIHYAAAPSLVLVCDGSGTYESQRGNLDLHEAVERPLIYRMENGKESISAYTFDGADLKLRYRIAYGASIDPRWLLSAGHIWEWCAQYCHGSFHEAAKVMGLAPFGDPAVHADLRTLSIDADGRVHVDFGPLLARFRTPNDAARDVTGDRHYEDLAAHIQHTTNAFLVDLVRFLLRRCGATDVCYTGGVALNSAANEHVARTLGLNLRMNGSCGDNGTAIGAALAVYHARTGVRGSEEVTEYYGRAYSSDEIAAALQGYSGKIRTLARRDLADYVSRAIASGAIVGWFQGRSEFGPRALGNRSILADPRSDRVQDHLNCRVKHREAFRPYAPAVAEERAAEFFDLDGPSPVMLRVVGVRTASLPAVTHVDGTARVQTVNRRQNEIFHELLVAFGELTGVPVLLNTSFNVAGEPIVETPADALRTFGASEMDLLVLGDVVVHRHGTQPIGD